MSTPGEGQRAALVALLQAGLECWRRPALPPDDPIRYAEKLADDLLALIHNAGASVTEPASDAGRSAPDASGDLSSRESPVKKASPANRDAGADVEGPSEPFAIRAEKAAAIFESRVRKAVGITVANSSMGFVTVAEIMDEFRRFVNGAAPATQEAPSAPRPERMSDAVAALAHVNSALEVAGSIIQAREVVEIREHSEEAREYLAATENALATPEPAEPREEGR